MNVLSWVPIYFWQMEFGIFFQRKNNSAENERRERLLVCTQIEILKTRWCNLKEMAITGKCNAKWPCNFLNFFSLRVRKIRSMERLSKRKRKRKKRRRKRREDKSRLRRPRRAIEFWWVGETYLITSSIPLVLQLSVDRTVDCCLTALALYIARPFLLSEVKPCHFPRHPSIGSVLTLVLVFPFFSDRLI